MSLRNLFIFLFACFIFTACDENKFEKYEGVWEGTYIGDQEGNWKVRIKENGTSEGIVHPLESDRQSFTISGSVNEDGELSMGATVFGQQITYDSFLSETALSGSWSYGNGNLSGTWSGTKRETERRFPYNALLNL